MNYIFCKRLNKKIKISDVAIPNKDYGWICDCGNWTKKDVTFHEVYDCKQRT